MNFLTINDILGGRRQKTNNEIILKLALFKYMAKKFVNIRFCNLEIVVGSGEQDSCYDLCPVSKSPS